MGFLQKQGTGLHFCAILKRTKNSKTSDRQTFSLESLFFSRLPLALCSLLAASWEAALSIDLEEKYDSLVS